MPLQPLRVCDALMKRQKLVFVQLFNQSLKLIYKQPEKNHVGGSTKHNGIFTSKGEANSFMCNLPHSFILLKRIIKKKDMK